MVKTHSVTSDHLIIGICALHCAYYKITEKWSHCTLPIPRIPYDRNMYFYIAPIKDCWK